MPYTSNKRFTVQTAGSNSGTWGAGGATGDDINTGLCGLLDTQLAASVSFSVSSTNVELTYAQVQSCRYTFTGTLLANITVSPLAGDATTYFNGFYFFSNTTSGNFTITMQNAHGSVVLPQTRRGIVYVNTAASIAPQIVAMVGSGTADPVPSGSNMMFYNASVPSGWSAVALNDYAIKIVTNGTTGGTTTGSVLYSTLFGRTATDGTALTTDQMPSHTHIYSGEFTREDNSGAPDTGARPLRESTFNAGSFTTASGTFDSIQSTGGGNSHDHGMDMRVFTAHCIIGQRN